MICFPIDTSQKSLARVMKDSYIRVLIEMKHVASKSIRRPLISTPINDIIKKQKKNVQD